MLVEELQNVCVCMNSVALINFLAFISCHMRCVDIYHAVKRRDKLFVSCLPCFFASIPPCLFFHIFPVVWLEPEDRKIPIELT